MLINAHPGFAEFIGVTGMVNEPAANQKPTTKMIQARVRPLSSPQAVCERNPLRVAA